MAQKLVDDGKLNHHPVKLLPKVGLAEVTTGMEMVRSKKISGEKCVVRLHS